MRQERFGFFDDFVLDDDDVVTTVNDGEAKSSILLSSSSLTLSERCAPRFSSGGEVLVDRCSRSLCATLCGAHHV